MSLSINPYATGAVLPPSIESGAVLCPSCSGGVVPSDTGSQICPYCGKRLQVRSWAIVRQNSNAAMALSDQATCFFHPDKAFQACCQTCGRFVCALCDLRLGADHVCPACFERGLTHTDAGAGKLNWRYRDVLFDSIALTVGWAWILFWPSLIAALPTVIVLHVKYRKAPRSYLIPRSGWRFWVAYLGIVWLPMTIAVSLFFARWLGRH